MLKRCLIVTAIVAAAGCKTLGFGDASQITEIATNPVGATVVVEDFGECQSPCRIEIDKPRTVKIAKAGFKPQQLQIKPGKSRVLIDLELVAPTTGVDETTLPEIR